MQMLSGEEPILAAAVGVLAGTVELRDRPTGVHSDGVATLAGSIGRRLRLEPLEQRDLRYAARLHDIGKLGVPDAVLRKPGPLGEDEWVLVQRHAVWGAELIEHLPGLERVARIVRHHHERYDGRGYPSGLAGEYIPLESRILAVADAFVAMTEERPYRPPLSAREATVEIRYGRGEQFDPR